MQINKARLQCGTRSAQLLRAARELAAPEGVALRQCCRPRGLNGFLR
jgi:hypothetical protein